MKKKKWIPFLLLPVLLLLCFFFFTEQMPKHYDFYENITCSEPAPAADRAELLSDITESQASDSFYQFYSWTGMNAHQVFWDENSGQLVFNVMFAKSAPSWQLNSAREYGMNTFLNKRVSNYIPDPYQAMVYGMDIETILIQIYVEDQLLSQDFYSGTREGFTFSYYENSRVWVDDQLSQPEAQAELESRLDSWLPKNRQIRYRKNLPGNQLYIQIQSASQVNPRYLEDIKSVLNTAFAAENTDLVLELYEQDGSLYYQDLFFELTSL